MLVPGAVVFVIWLTFVSTRSLSDFLSGPELVFMNYYYYYYYYYCGGGGGGGGWWWLVVECGSGWRWLVVVVGGGGWWWVVVGGGEVYFPYNKHARVNTSHRFCNKRNGGMHNTERITRECTQNTTLTSRLALTGPDKQLGASDERHVTDPLVRLRECFPAPTAYILFGWSP
jgi:hypothetical protein